MGEDMVFVRRIDHRFPSPLAAHLPNTSQRRKPGWRTPIPGFSSTQNSGPSVGGLSSSSMMATALVANSGSRSFIQVSKTVQANLVPLEDDADGALAGTTQAELGMGGHVLRQVVDTPVGLPSSR